MDYFHRTCTFYLDGEQRERFFRAVVAQTVLPSAIFLVVPSPVPPLPPNSRARNRK